MSILAEAEQKLERRYALKKSGVDLSAVEKRVCRIFDLKPDDLCQQGRQKPLTQARSLFCFWASRELGISQKSLAGRFSLTEPAICYALRRGQKLAKERGYELLGDR
jgi:chromosomal replication initiation ATPase DnaA